MKKNVKGQFIKILKQSKMSIKRIAKASGVSVGTINNWYYGTAIPTIDKAVAVLEAVGCEITISKKGRALAAQAEGGKNGVR